MAPLRPKHFGPNHAVATATMVAALCESRRWKVSFLCFAIWSSKPAMEHQPVLYLLSSFIYS